MCGKTGASFKAIKLKRFQQQAETLIQSVERSSRVKELIYEYSQRGIENDIREAEETLGACAPVSCVINDL